MTFSRRGSAPQTRKTLRRGGLLALPLVLALSACGIGGGGASTNRAGSCEISPEAASGKAITGEPSGTITFQTTNLKQDFSPYFTKLISEFEKKYPKVDVTWQDDPGDASFTQRLVTDAQGCKLPDVLNLNQTTAYALHKENFLLDLTAARPGIQEPFIPSVWDSLRFPGEKDSYVMPWYWGLTGLQTFNAELMKKAGLDPENPPTTLSEQFNAAKKVAAASGGQFYSFAANPRWRVPGDWQLMDAKVTNTEQTTFTFADDPKIVDWLTQYKDIYAAGALPKDTLSSDTEMTQLYSAGDLVWGSTNASFLRYVKDTNVSVYDKTGVAPLLDARGRAIMEGQLVAIPSTSKNPAAALAFAEFLLSPEKQTEFVSDPRISNFPSTTASMDIPKFTQITGDTPLDKANRISVELADKAENMFIYNWSDAVNTAVVSQLQLAISGKKSPTQALKDAQDKANSILKNQD
ncbi:extracellular solute-binding protein [Leifsonia sp. McL0607]|uniref:extracellular solute-binding protein n=1 Tax=Leifsonia sp. McL0607 TaxID=3415672 RepID=UPI003CED3D60